MAETTDNDLLAQFSRENSETAFAGIIERYVNLVYSAALRRIGNPHAAEEITQAVFIILARKVKSLSAKTILPGWLHQTTRLTAANYLRAEIRRRKHEHEAFMQTALTESENFADDEIWQQLAPHLDEAISKLRAKDRDALILRYFENKNLREVGAALGVEERAAQKRVNRAVEKLRRYFSKRGISLTTAIIAGVISANSVHAAPVGLATTITATALKGSAVAATTLTLVKGTMKMMTWMKIKFAAGIGIIALLAGGVATVAISQTSHGDKLTAQEIVQKSQDAYAALSSYSDEGKEVGYVGTTAVAPHTFSIKLARPNLYQIKWTQDLGFYSQTGIVWSAGSGDYLKMAQVSKPSKYPNADGALSAAMGISGGASGIIPKSFFNLKSSILNIAMQSASKKPDEKIDGNDCYVLTQSKNGRTETLWIAKQDFLIRQIENDTSAAVLKLMLEDQAKKNPEMHLPTTVVGDVKSVQTHKNIVMNQKFSPANFAP